MRAVDHSQEERRARAHRQEIRFLCRTSAGEFPTTGVGYVHGRLFSRSDVSWHADLTRR